MSDAAAAPRVLLTGSSGFLGQFVAHELKIAGCEVLKISRSTGFNLLSETDTLTAVLTAKPQVVIHLAAALYPPEEQGSAFRDNLRMGMQVLNASLLAGAKFVTVAPRSIYAAPEMFAGSKFKTLPETCLHVGAAADAQGDAKRSLAMACSRYHSQYKNPYAFLVLAPLYGPMQMSWNFGNGAHTGVGFMVKSILDLSTEPEFAFSGYSGEEILEYLFIQDAAKAVVQAALSLEHDGIVNIASGAGTSRRSVAKIVAEAIGYKGKIEFDEKSVVSPVPLSGELAAKLMGWKPEVELSDGIGMTATWYATEHEPKAVKA